REEMGREKLVDAIKEFVAGSQDTIRGQVRKMGSSCDWTRERYTMDAALNRCVNEVFCKMFADDLIYRGHRTVNWDPKLQTNVSDDEVDHEDRTDPFFTFQYGPFEIGTVRPETKFGDKYVVMHPDDERYAQYKHGDTFECEWINGPIVATIIKDKAADPEMGTGVMTITPWHSGVDFEIAERHGLDKEQVIDFDGKLLPIAGEFEGMKITDARAKIVEKLDGKGLLVKTDEKYMHSVALNSRGGGTIEPQIKLQWFINVNKEAVNWKGKKMSLKQVMQDVIHSGDIKIIPERFEKTYFSWVDNLRDWCISRQIWWGHQIPIWYKGAEEFSGVQPPDGEGWTQDPDTLDTWFSSALWTWSTLVDPKLTEDYSLTLKEMLDQSPDYKKFHPTQVMETGYDIIFFWVARMILMTTYATGEIPFEKVYLHGMIRSRDGQKMSKSKPETMIDPLDIIPTYGADALRMSMIVGQSPGNDQKLFEEKIGGYRNFINKLWNASRFVLMQCEEAKFDVHSKADLSGDLSLADKALLSALQDLVTDVSDGLTDYRLSETGEKLYSFTWDYFCDWYLELSKGEANPAVLIHTLRTLLTLLHPYCPFVTEELWDSVKPTDAGMLIAHEWPVVNERLKDQTAQDDLQTVIDVISGIRSLRSDQGIEPGAKISITLLTEKHGMLLESQESHIKSIARVESLTIDTNPGAAKPDNAASSFLKDVEIHMPLDGLIDKDKEIEKLGKEKAKLEGFIKGVNAKLGNEKFVENAQAEVVALEREKLSTAEGKLAKVLDRLESLK
ncbi:valine--tRNA ligase, partial [Candidatus Peregrinibacteria bacterium]|nr:valine--tRNA ligase [Candidatus Peregrinibacteria bacterium]